MYQVFVTLRPAANVEQKRAMRAILRLMAQNGDLTTTRDGNVATVYLAVATSLTTDLYVGARNLIMTLRTNVAVRAAALDVAASWTEDGQAWELKADVQPL